MNMYWIITRFVFKLHDFDNNFLPSLSIMYESRKLKKKNICIILFYLLVKDYLIKIQKYSLFVANLILTYGRTITKYNITYTHTHTQHIQYKPQPLYST